MDFISIMSYFCFKTQKGVTEEFYFLWQFLKAIRFSLSLSTALGKALNHSITAHIEICIIPLGTTTTRGKATSIGTYTIAADVEFTVVITTHGL